MTRLITLENISLAYGLHPLLDHVKFHLNEKERVCLIGRNGAGKSSLLKILEGCQPPDSGNVWRKPGLKVAFLNQELPHQLTQTVYEYVADGLHEVGKLLAEYHLITQKLHNDPSQKNIDLLAALQHEIDVKGGYGFEQSIKHILTRLELNPDTKLCDLSGGWQRRAALAKALVIEPDVLLLDEPTNHLDIDAIKWLEAYLLSSQLSIIFITHDRSLLQRLATRIIELDRGQLTSWPGDYQKFLVHKEELLNAEAKANDDFDKKLAEEERWIRQGIKARRTRNEGRVRALIEMRRERSKRREVEGKAEFNANEASLSGQLVVEAKNISQVFGEQTIVSHFSIRIMRGDKIGLIGPNGIGKSTLLNILLGKLPPSSGTVTLGTKLQIAYFDQLRLTLDLDKTVIENVVEGTDTIVVNGKSKHIISYLSDFLFTPERARTPVKALSGGECNRLLLAKLFAQPSNLLVMDEPTNDLDIETLELLEDLLSQYQGTLLLVSHDRTFLDNVVTSSLVFEGNGVIKEYAGGYQTWLEQTSTIKDIPIKSSKTKQEFNEPKKATKLSYKDQRELESLPAKIESLEKNQHDLSQLIADPAFYKNTQEKISSTMDELKKIEAELALSYERWETLENLQKQLNVK